MRSLRFLLVSAAIVVSACAQKVREPAAAPSTSPITASFDAAAIRRHADALAQQLNIDGVQKAELMARLDAFLASATFEAAKDQVRAVGVYRWGEGGLVLKVGRGDGRILVAGAAAAEPFVIDTLSAGAQVGGSASWGIVLATGLDSADELAGKYDGTVTSATALDESAGALSMKHRDRSHTLWFIGVAEGLSANAGAEEIRFNFGEPE